MTKKELYQLKETFLQEWPLSRIKNIALEEYTNLDKTSFCYWLEAKTTDLGSIWGGSAYKFGIYKRKDTSTIITVDNRVTDGEYAWFQKYGDTKETAFQTVKNTLLNIIENTQSGALENIDTIDLGDAYKWKIAFLYGNFNVVNIFKHEPLLEAAQSLGFKGSNKNYSALNRFILSKKEPQQDYFEFTDLLWSKTSLATGTKYWLYAPGEKANKWEEFYSEGIMALGWDELGDLDQYQSKKEIKQKLQELENVTSTKQNDTTANFDFYKEMKQGDIVFVKKGTSELLGYGIVSSDYYFDENRDTYKSCRKVDWKLKGNWKLDFGLPVKTLTDVTKYETEDPAYTKYHERLMGIMLGETVNKKKEINLKDKFIDWLVANVSDGNYYINQFSSNLNKLQNEINDYETIYKKNFSSELFDINVNNYKNQIEIIKNNIYRKATPFAEYNNNQYSGRPTAILGNNNYLKFLNDYFSNQNAMVNNTKLNTFSLNQILYGPPGTGKTYNSINMAIAIANPGFNIKQDHTLVKEEYDRLEKEDKILFSTFHQSMSYEDFIEGIKPLAPQPNESLNYDIQAGIFKIACARAAYLCYKKYNQVKGVSASNYTFDDLYVAFIESIMPSIKKGQFPIYKTITGKEVEIYDVNSQDSIKARAMGSKATHVAPLTQENLEKLYNKFKSITEIKSLDVVRDTVQVSPRSTEFYAVFRGLKEFEKSYKPDNTIVEEDVIVDTTEDLEKVKKFSAGIYTEAIKQFGDVAEPVVLIIDEINRGNVSAIFGELITLIENDKRIGALNELHVTLPYSKKEFGVPKNLYIIGTMNTADRSVEALDTALRRRFSFTEIMSEAELLKDIAFADFTLEEVLVSINERIEVLLDRDHTIGHSYFLKIKNGDTEALKAVFKNNIFPLLQEYFYHDYEKIALILGEGFVRVKENQTVKFAKFNAIATPDIATQFELIANIENIETAVQLLLNRNV